jgi:thymidylate synthase (FAD)
MSSLNIKEISVLNCGFVRLVDCLPRYVPEGRGCDFAIVRNARVSVGSGLKSVEADQRLINRLYDDKHTSPFESVSFVFHIKCPLFVAIHFIRHRTAKINMFSQRYASVDKIGSDFYTPDFRVQSKINNQGSDNTTINEDKYNELDVLIKKADNHINELFAIYDYMIKAGMSRETARYCLPESTYTSFYFEMDLNNLIKFFALRCAEETQYETRVFAIAMKELIKPLLPMLQDKL